MRQDDSYERVITDPTLRDGVLIHAMDNEGLTFGEAVAILTLMRGNKPFNKNPGVFKDMEPVK